MSDWHGLRNIKEKVSRLAFFFIMGLITSCMYIFTVETSGLEVSCVSMSES